MPSSAQQAKNSPAAQPHSQKSKNPAGNQRANLESGAATRSSAAAALLEVDDEAGTGRRLGDGVHNVNPATRQSAPSRWQHDSGPVRQSLAAP
jgi:hypothetical protein